MKYTTRLINLRDFYQAAAVINQAFLKQVVARTDRQTITADDIQNHILDESKEAFVIENESGRILGAALITLEQNYVYIWCVSVLAEFQGLELGKKLMNFIENRALTVHKKQLAILSVVHHPEHTQQRLIAWYESQGYEYVYTQEPSNISAIWKKEFHKGLALKVFQKKLSLD